VVEGVAKLFKHLLDPPSFDFKALHPRTRFSWVYLGYLFILQGSLELKSCGWDSRRKPSAVSLNVSVGVQCEMLPKGKEGQTRTIPSGNRT
jgi:hypothetical protein